MKAKFEVHESHIPLWERKDWRYSFLMGGRGNGRSGTASRYVLSQILGKEYTRGAIMRATREDIRASCWGEILDRIHDQHIEDTRMRIVDNDMFVEYGTNSLRAHGFRASSGSLTARLKSLAGYNLIWIEEAEEIGESEFRTLDDTLRTIKGRIRVVFTLNTPPKNHWILKRWFDLKPSDVQGFYVPYAEESKDVLYIPGTWRENEPNLDKHTIERYENYKQTNPSYYYQVICGLSPEEVRGKIFSGWQQIDSIPPEARLVRFGEDFGWFPDPACAVSIYYWNGGYIIDELAYGTELTNEFLAREIKKAGQATVIADSAEPKSIAEQNKYGIHVIGAEKGKDSVNFRIKVLAQKKIFVTRRSKNVWESYENYAWAEDKDGNPKNEPEHFWSHCFAPETLVYTTKGKIRIDELVGKEGFLYSLDGKIQRFHSVRKTKENTEVISLSFNDGNTLTVTPDHLLLLPNGQWIEAGLLRLSDMIQSTMYEKSYIQWKNIYQVFRGKLLQGICRWKEMVSSSLCLVFSQWTNTTALSYSSQGRESGQQFTGQSRIKTSSTSFERTYDTGKKKSTERMDQKDTTIGQQMAWVKRGNTISQMAWQEKLGRQKTNYERMCTLPYKIQNAYQSLKRKILWAELWNESQTKTIIRITRGFCEQTYNLEVEDTHCLMANGVIAHNSMDAASYAIASLHNKQSDIIVPERPRVRTNIAV